MTKHLILSGSYKKVKNNHKTLENVSIILYIKNIS